MKVTRRDFLRDGVAAFTITFAAPSFLDDIARAQGARSRNLVVLYLSGGNDALSTLVPYTDPFYYSRRPSIGVPAGQVLQVGTDAAGRALGLHPRLTGMREIFNQGRMAIIQRTGYQNSSRSHFEGTDIWNSADPRSPQGLGWLGKYLDTLPQPVDSLAGWNTVRETPRALLGRTVAVPAIPDARTYSFASPNNPAEAANERAAAIRIASHVPVDRPNLAFVNTSSRGALETLDRVAAVSSYNGTVAYPNNGFALALRTVAGSIVRGIGTRVFWVQTGGYDTHSGQGTNGGAYTNLMATLNDGVFAFYNDLRNQGLLNETLLLQFSEFSRRISENGSQGTDHGAAGMMMAIGGGVRGGLYGTAASLNPDPANPTLENNAGDVRYETDFRSVYARVLDGWLGSDSVSILGGDFRAGAPAIV
jgi:uncharacterized protein (DUF1501 family)